MIKTLLVALTFGLFFGCNHASTDTAAPEKPPEAAKEAGGTGDSGGGNGYKGKPLDSYQVSIWRSPAYIKMIQPIMDKLSSTDPVVFHLFSQMLTEKPWYLLPGPLNAFPADKIGSVVPTDQLALQTLDAVWLDQNKFAQMDSDSQGELLLHEILMGIRLLRFKSDKAQCLFVAPRNSFCENLRDRPRGDASDLTPQDYADVRATVRAFRQIGNLVMLESVEDLLATKGFSFPQHQFQTWETSTQMALTDVVTWLDHSISRGFSPKNGFNFTSMNSADQTVLSSSESCSVSYGVDGDNLIFKMKTAHAVLLAYGEYRSVQPVSWVFEESPLHNVFLVENGESLKKKAVNSESVFWINLKFKGTDLERVEFDKMDCSASSDGKSYGCGTPVNPVNYACGVSDKIHLGQ